MAHFNKKSDNSGEKRKRKKDISISMGIQRKFFLVFFLFILIITITTTGVVYEYSESALREELRDHLVDLAKTCALMIDADNHEEIKSVLQSVMAVNPKIADIYMMVKSDEENIFLFVVDAYDPAIGAEYDVGAYPKMKKAFDGAISNCGDEGCSAYAPIYDEAGKAIAILGVELYMDEFLDEGKNPDVIQDFWVGVVANAASEIDADKLAELKTPEDEHTAAYGELKSILQSVKAKNPEIYEIYIMAESDKENILLYLVDVYEPPEIREEYNVSEYPQMQLAFDGAIADEEIAIDKWGAWLSAYAPIYDDNGTAVAIVGLDMDVGNVVIAEKNLRNGLIFIFLAALLLSLIASIFVSRYFTNPIIELVEGTKAISRGDFDYKVAIKSGNELEALGDAFNKMAQRVKNSFTETAVKKELENTLNTMTDTLIVLDPDGNITKANKAAFNLLGYSEAELIGMPFDKIVGKREGGKIGLEKRIREAKASVTSFETTYLTKDGKEIPMNFAASIMKDEKGELQGIVCNADDITERKRAEQELAKRAKIINEITDAVIITDLSGNITSYNTGAEQMYGYKAQEVIGKPVSMFYSAEDIPRLMSQMGELLKGNRISSVESRIIGENKKEVPVILSLAPISNSEGKIIELIGIAKDITEWKRVEDALRESHEKLKELDKMKTNFLNVAYHELRSPLAPIVGYASLLEQSELNEKQKKYARIIEESAYKLEELIESLLEVTRLEAGKAELSLEKMPIPEIVNNLLERFEPQADAKRQTISTVVPEGTEVEGDKQKITAIFDNLISNAIKYTGEKGRIDLVVEDRKEGIRVCVADTGIGIPKEQLPRVFERFYTVDTPLAGKRGLGLGLAIVKGYVKLHGGKVWVTSEFGKGSKFWFTLPKRQR